MLRRIVIHVGPAKTGTSAIQFALAKADPGPFLYPKVGRWRDSAHHNIAHSLFPNLARPESAPLALDELVGQLRIEALSSSKNILISTESLSVDTIQKFVDFTQKALEGVAHDILLAIVLRSHVERIASLYNQSVKDSHLGERRSPDDFLAETAHRSLYRPLLEAVLATGHRVRVVNYHGENLVRRFVRELGADFELVSSETRRNVSVGRKGLVTLLEVNRVMAPADRPMCFDALRRIRGLFSGGFIPFSKRAVGELDELFSHDLEFVTQSTGTTLEFDETMKYESLSISSIEFQEIVEAFRRGGVENQDLYLALSSKVAPST